MPRSPKGRAAARGLDARLRLQHAFMPAGDASLKTAQLIKMLVDSNDGIYRVGDARSSHFSPGAPSSGRSMQARNRPARPLSAFFMQARLRRMPPSWRRSARG
jgi:hypothetical protein